MEINYLYHKTQALQKLLLDIEVARKLFDLLPPQPRKELRLQHQALLKSALFSARIEGNPLRPQQVKTTILKEEPGTREKLEVFNISRALQWISQQQKSTPLSPRLLCQLHETTMKGLHPDAGRFRSEASAIFNQAGIAIYLAPPPSEIPSLVGELTHKLTNISDPGPIQAAYAHFVFEKIHPFLDGNGRVGRLLSTVILKNTGYDFRGLISLEEYFESQRQIYYDLLAIPGKDITEFINFSVEGIAQEIEKTLTNLRQPQKELPEDRLLPRRREILEIIRDHRLVSFDFIRRRFSAVSESLIHYDLRQLTKEGFVRKLGSTRGCLYAPVE